MQDQPELFIPPSDHRESSGTVWRHGTGEWGLRVGLKRSGSRRLLGGQVSAAAPTFATHGHHLIMVLADGVGADSFATEVVWMAGELAEYLLTHIADLPRSKAPLPANTAPRSADALAEALRDAVSTWLGPSSWWRVHAQKAVSQALAMAEQERAASRGASPRALSTERERFQRRGVQISFAIALIDLETDAGAFFRAGGVNLLARTAVGYAPVFPTRLKDEGSGESTFWRWSSKDCLGGRDIEIRALPRVSGVHLATAGADGGRSPGSPADSWDATSAELRERSTSGDCASLTWQRRLAPPEAAKAVVYPEPEDDSPEKPQERETDQLARPAATPTEADEGAVVILPAETSSTGPLPSVITDGFAPTSKAEPPARPPKAAPRITDELDRPTWLSEEGAFSSGLRARFGAIGWRWPMVAGLLGLAFGALSASLIHDSGNGTPSRSPTPGTSARVAPGVDIADLEERAGASAPAETRRARRRAARSSYRDCAAGATSKEPCVRRLALVLLSVDHCSAQGQMQRYVRSFPNSPHAPRFRRYVEKHGVECPGASAGAAQADLPRGPPK